MVEENKKALRGDPRLHDATTPVVAASPDEFLEQAKSRSKPTVIQRKEKKV